MIETQAELAARKGESKIKISKKQVFASTPREYLKMHRNCFKSFIQNDMAYEDDEIRILLRIFDLQITEKNIMEFINRKSQEIYLAIVNDKLDLIACTTNKIYVKDKKKPKKRDLTKQEALLPIE